MLNIAILDAKTLGEDIDLSSFERIGKLSIYPVTKEDEIVERIKEQEIVIVNKVVLNAEKLQHAKNLKLICLTATGTNNIDLEYAKKNNIAVCNVAGYSTHSVAQHTFAMLFYLLEHLKYYDNYVVSGKFAQNDSFTHIAKPFYEIRDKTWGIIGLGNIGREVAKIAEAFGAKVIYYSASGRNNSDKYERVELDEMLAKSDIISVHAPLNAKTKNLIKYEQVKLMKKEAILINVGRGGIIEESGLARALKEDLIRGAALDVVEAEPIEANNPLLEVDKEKVLITPHIAWASMEARKTLMEEVVMNIEAFLKGEVRNRVE